MKQNLHILVLPFVLLFPLVPGFSQTGPGGVGSSTNNKLWLDVNRGVTTSGANVTSWADQSGAGNNATPPSVAAYPTYVAASVNGYPSINFDGTDDEFRVTDNATLDLTSWHIFLVMKADVLKNYNAFFVKGDDNLENYEVLSYSDGNIHVPVRWTDATRTAPNSAGGFLTTTNFDVFEYTYVSTLGRDVYKNGSNIYTDNDAKTPTANNFDLYIGNERSTAGRFTDGNIAEAILFNAPVNSAQRIIVNNYLAAKYNRTLTGIDYYTMDNAGNGNYDHEVAGIGRIDASNTQTDSRGSGMVRISAASSLGNGEFFMWGHDNGATGSWGVSDLPAGIQARSGRVWRASEFGGDVGTLDVAFDLSTLGPVTLTDLRLLIDTDNDGIFSDEVSPAGVITGATFSGGLYHFAGVNIADGQRFTIASINYAQTPLPVEFLSFNGIYTDNKVILDWATATEINNDYFVIERSKEGLKFEELARVKGAGTTTQQMNYLETDFYPIEGTSYYRLKQVDFNGDFSYSAIVPVNIHFDKGKNLWVYPNPTTADELKVELTGLGGEEVLLVLLDVNGNTIVSKMQVAVEGDLVIGFAQGKDIKPGTYIITASSKNELFSRKVIIR